MKFRLFNRCRFTSCARGIVFSFLTLYPDVCCRNFRDTAVFDNVPRGNEDILAYVETRSDARRAVVVFDHNVRDTGNRKGSEGVSP